MKKLYVGIGVVALVGLAVGVYKMVKKEETIDELKDFVDIDYKEPEDDIIDPDSEPIDLVKEFAKYAKQVVEERVQPVVKEDIPVVENILNNKEVASISHEARMMKKFCGNFKHIKDANVNNMIIYLTPASTLDTLRKCPDIFGCHTEEEIVYTYNDLLGNEFKYLVENEATKDLMTAWMNNERRVDSFTAEEISTICETIYDFGNTDNKTVES